MKRSLLHRWLPLATAIVLTACSTARPWINKPITAAAAAAALPISPAATAASPSIVAAITLSGGGARAAAFGLGVLEELKATRFEWEGRKTSLLDEVGLISGVSGGSVLATYYAAFGDEVFSRFHEDFLQADFQTGLILDALSPPTLYRLGSPWWGRSNAFNRRLDPVFRGMTFGELRAQRARPQLLVTATDLTTGGPFEFTPEQFGLICSELDSVPLSFAVAASSSVPLLLSPMTLRNYADRCAEAAPSAAADPAGRNLSARLLDLVADSYRNSQERPYIHLVDGGVVDNLGVRGLLERTLAGGTFEASFKGLQPGSVHQIVLISVNSERDTAERIDGSDRVPGHLQVLDALVFGAGSRLSKETTMMIDDVAQRMNEALRFERGRPGSPFAADAEIHVINVGLRQLKDPEMRRNLMQVPTALTILPIQVEQLQRAGREVLRESPAFQRLRRSLGADPQSLTAAAADPTR
ncbi:patatin-like phospholipase family protein [Roseateles violae]|uniref:Patatin-like phospholipase family protein n=1 Tax=Roseateles violae TaxID=3058042 RepID=A0ABT8DZD5_9BURK|nr:patatin-like phospholipase family protein [Pelomonas sp. PFR6]MDN3922929.1 patatin-like phospholipase family protein [Pelomonas sp. PFR6]